MVDLAFIIFASLVIIGKFINDFKISTQTLLGVSHFTFYNHSLGPKAACVLRHYMEEGLAYANNATQDGTIQHRKYKNYQTEKS